MHAMFAGGIDIACAKLMRQDACGALGAPVAADNALAIGKSDNAFMVVDLGNKRFDIFFDWAGMLPGVCFEKRLERWCGDNHTKIFLELGGRPDNHNGHCPETLCIFSLYEIAFFGMSVIATKNDETGADGFGDGTKDVDAL
jgi:hypothetical protein